METADGRYIIVTQEDDYVVSVISMATSKIVYRYGVPGVPGAGPNHLFNPDETTNACMHDPPRRFGSPNGAFPMTDGNYLVTEINGD